MWNIGPYSKEENRLPPIGSLICLLFLLPALVSLYILLSIWTPIPGRQYYIAEQIIIMAACTSVLLSYRWASQLVFLGVTALTVEKIIDYPFQLHRLDPLSPHPVLQILHLLASIALYWVAFLWYKNWRAKRAD